jgi:hypothetical protein
VPVSDGYRIVVGFPNPKLPFILQLFTAGSSRLTYASQSAEKGPAMTDSFVVNWSAGAGRGQERPFFSAVWAFSRLYFCRNAF